MTGTKHEKKNQGQTTHSRGTKQQLEEYIENHKITSRPPTKTSAEQQLTEEYVEMQHSEAKSEEEESFIYTDMETPDPLNYETPINLKNPSMDVTKL